LISDQITSYGNLKNEAHAEINIPLFAGLSVQMCGRLGLILNNKKQEALAINHLFFPGGPLSLRGFKYAGAGPHEEGVPMGVNVSFCDFSMSHGL
jgi:outer membrane protein insertion porin family